MTAGVACHRSIRCDGHIQTAATEAAEMAAGRTASVVAAAPVGITTYDADGNCRPRCCPRGAATADVMMTMAGERGGEETARQGDGEATATATRRRRRRQGNDEATRMRRQSAMAPQVAGAMKQLTSG